MDQRLKQRLVGAGVLVLGAVWVVPELFEGEGTDEPEVEVIEEVSDEFSSRIVPLDEPEPELEEETEVVEVDADDTPVSEPEIPQTEIESSTDSALVVEEEVIDTSVVVAAVVDVPVEPEQGDKEWIPIPLPKPRGDETRSNGERLGLTVWAIQLGSFGQSENALGLRDRLREKGYTAFVQTAYNDEGAVTRVFVGPELYREEAQSVRDRLHTETTLDGLVVRYPGG